MEEMKHQSISILDILSFAKSKMELIGFFLLELREAASKLMIPRIVSLLNMKMKIAYKLLFFYLVATMKMMTFI